MKAVLSGAIAKGDKYREEGAEQSRYYLRPYMKKVEEDVLVH